jgi:hypothetical protein
MLVEPHEGSDPFRTPSWPDAFHKTVAAALAPLDVVLTGMIGAGLGIEALALYLGGARVDLLERVAALGLEIPHDRPMRRAGGKNPWAPEDVRRLVALWIDGVQVRSIAEALGRSRGGIYAKRRRIGLPPRSRASLRYLLTDECRAIVAPWVLLPDCVTLLIPKTNATTPPTLLSSAAGAADDVQAFCLNPSQPAVIDPTSIDHDPFNPPAPREKTPSRRGVKKRATRDGSFSWANPRSGLTYENRLKLSLADQRLSELAFGGLQSSTIAEIMSDEFGRPLNKCAIDNRISRLEIIRDRNALSSEYIPEEIMEKARVNKSALGAAVGFCGTVERQFWWYKTRGGSRTECREARTKKYRNKRSNNPWGWL